MNIERFDTSKYYRNIVAYVINEKIVFSNNKWHKEYKHQSMPIYLEYDSREEFDIICNEDPNHVERYVKDYLNSINKNKPIKNGDEIDYGYKLDNSISKNIALGFGFEVNQVE